MCVRERERESVCVCVCVCVCEREREREKESNLERVGPRRGDATGRVNERQDYHQHAPDLINTTTSHHYGQSVNSTINIYCSHNAQKNNQK